MADYHAVLQRTLSGFSNPKPELRIKLYDRARTTIARQLENRTPAVTGSALIAELDKLEYSIFQIERSYDPNYPEPVPKGDTFEKPTTDAPSPPPPSEPETDAAADSESEDTSAKAATKQGEPETAPAAPPEPQTDVAADGKTEDAPAKVATEQAEPGTAPSAPPDPSFVDALAVTPPLPAEEAVQSSPPAEVEPKPAQPGFEPLQPPEAAVDPAVEPAPPAEQDVNDAAVDQWAEEFLSQPPASPQPDGSPIPAAEPPVEAPALPLPEELQPEPAPAPTWSPNPHPDAAAADPYYQPQYAPQPEQPQYAPQPEQPQYAPQPEQPQYAPQMPPASTMHQYEQPFGAAEDENLVIPPAPGFGSGGKKRGRKRGFMKWFLLLLVLGLLGAGGYYGWLNKELVLERIGMSHLLDDPIRPKPVKTITITPEIETPVEAIQPPKAESRLSENGEEETAPTESPTPTPTLQPVIETPVPEPSTNGTIPVAQNAILYEEGATAAENTVDSGRVVWSVVQEEPASGVPKEPAIRARIEVPGRDVVLIMKIKRNADKALPASHLIELVFAVPDEFSGGAIDQVSRFVLKQSEQGRGDGLVGVPARIADGIFLIALNNLEQARQQNESLLKTRDWIDIPLQYRTGRRALMTIEKGIPGEKVFEEVFEAWSKL